MKEQLAERLLAIVMNWTTSEVAQYRPELVAMANYKYDFYQQFSPGKRFIESLGTWLNQFKTPLQKNEAFEFIRKKLIFISNEELFHLISLVYKDNIKPLLINKAASILGFENYKLKKILNDNIFKVLLKQTLYLGLSDGARTDIFRRFNIEISHEQIFQNYRIEDNQAQEIHKELSNNIKNLGYTDPKDHKIKMVFLLDDFSASSISYLRKEQHEDIFKGKIQKALENFKKNSSVEFLFDEHLEIYIIIYVITEDSIKKLETNINEWKIKFNYDGIIKVIPIQIIPENVKISGKIEELLQEYYDPSIEDKHYKKGNCTKPYLGFDMCALPLVLFHNTPNNSIPLLWFDESKTITGLFPRVIRHKEQ